MRSIAFIAFVAVAGCGGSEPPARAPATVAAASSTQPAEGAVPASSLRRSDVVRTVRAGLGAFLQRVELDEHPVFVAGKFHGFRIAALRGDPAFWSGVDLKPGDVVTQVNGFGIEHPEDALQAFNSLEVSSELRIAYERDGDPRELRYSILDDAPADHKAAP
jgi:general secretion pathway protein C